MRKKPQAVIKLPVLFPWQRWTLQRKMSPFMVFNVGRRGGKTALLEYIVNKAAIAGLTIGWFVPDYKRMIKPWERFTKILAPIAESINATKNIINLATGGSVRFWSLLDLQAGRGDFYDLIVIDEADYAKHMGEIWEKSIEPTILTAKKPLVIVASTPKGYDEDSWYWQINQPGSGWTVINFDSRVNPQVTQEKWLAIKAKTDPDVFAQEYEAKFVKWNNRSFFNMDKIPVVPNPTFGSRVFATVDTTLKGGKRDDGSTRDGTAVAYWMKNDWDHTHPLVLLDWDVTDCASSVLIDWMPRVFDRLEELARECHVVQGNWGVWMEDKAAGCLLIPQLKGRGYTIQATPSRLTAMGKDGKAWGASSFIYAGKVVFSERAWEKEIEWDGKCRNHMRHQLESFKLNDANRKEPDDLFDVFVDGTIMTLDDTLWDNDAMGIG